MHLSRLLVKILVVGECGSLVRSVCVLIDVLGPLCNLILSGYATNTCMLSHLSLPLLFPILWVCFYVLMSKQALVMR